MEGGVNAFTWCSSGKGINETLLLIEGEAQQQQEASSLLFVVHTHTHTYIYIL